MRWTILFVDAARESQQLAGCRQGREGRPVQERLVSDDEIRATISVDVESLNIENGRQWRSRHYQARPAREITGAIVEQDNVVEDP